MHVGLNTSVECYMGDIFKLLFMNVCEDCLLGEVGETGLNVSVDCLVVFYVKKLLSYK